MVSGTLNTVLSLPSKRSPKLPPVLVPLLGFRVKLSDVKGMSSQTCALS